MGCKVFIDESGDTGIKVVRNDGSPGASPYFVVAASVMPARTCEMALGLLDEIEAQIPKSWRHATDLNHSQTTFFARKAATLNQRCFAVVSKKSTLGSYANEIEWKPHKFYIKCMAYLLAKVGKYISAFGQSFREPQVIFEGRNHDYDALIRYVNAIKANPMHPEAKHLGVFNPFGFVQKQKDEEKLLKFADLTAHAVYQCVNKTDKNFQIPETRYLSELAVRFGADTSGRVINHGIKCVHSLEGLELDPDVKELWSSMRAKPRPTS